MNKIIVYIAALLLSVNSLSAAPATCGQSNDLAVKVLQTDSTTVVLPFYDDDFHEGRVLFQSRRVDRAVNKGKYIFKGEYMGGISASYLTMDGDNTEMFLLLENINASGSMVSVKPYVSYFYRDNRAVGVRFGYSSINLQIDSATLDLGAANDINFDVPYIMYDDYSYSYSIFHRSYTALDRKGNIALFADIDLEYSRGKSTFEYQNGGLDTHVRSHNQSCEISFSPGISAFMFNNVSASLSFQFGGFNYTNIKQYDAEGNYVGTRDSSKMQFMFNVFEIKFGLNFHIW
ncbi:MAG: hypothetical protein SNG35_02980 [Rikenellaceae bacterium]